MGKVFDVFRDQPSAFAEYEGAEVLRVPMLTRGSGGGRLLLNYLSFVVSAIVFGPFLLRDKSTDVIFVFEPSPVTVGLPALWLGKIKKAPVVFWALDLWPESLSAMGVIRSKWLLGLVGHMVSFIYNRCTLVLGQSRGFLECIARYCADKSKIRYFPSWAEDVFMDGNARPATEVPYWTNGFTVMFAGNIGEAQDMPAVLDAADLLKHKADIRWIIIGDGSKFNWLRSEVLRRGLGEQVLLPGRFSMERMPSFYTHADALLVSLKRDPTYGITIPGKLQSYMMAGIPLLGMLDGESATIIRDAQAGIACDAGDSAGLARAIMVMAATPRTERLQLGLNGRKYALAEFGRTQLMDRLEALLEEAVTKRNLLA